MTTARTSGRSRPLRHVLATTAAVGLIVAGPTPAQAHVRVHADNATAGSFSALTFRVPTESNTTSTVKVQVNLPQDNPFLHVSIKPLPGWTANVSEESLPRPVDVDGTQVTKAARTITWTADQAAGIKPGEYQEFAISAGPLPAAGAVLLPATQTYSDGTVVKWDQPTPAGGEEPEYPAPALVTTAGTGDEHDQPGSPGTTAPANTPTAAASSDTTARILAGAGLLAGLVGVGVAAVALCRRPGDRAS